MKHLPDIEEINYFIGIVNYLPSKQNPLFKCIILNDFLTLQCYLNKYEKKRCKGVLLVLEESIEIELTSQLDYFYLKNKIEIISFERLLKASFTSFCINLNKELYSKIDKLTNHINEMPLKHNFFSERAYKVGLEEMENYFYRWYKVDNQIEILGKKFLIEYPIDYISEKR